MWQCTVGSWRANACPSQAVSVGLTVPCSVGVRGKARLWSEPRGGKTGVFDFLGEGKPNGDSGENHSIKCFFLEGQCDRWKEMKAPGRDYSSRAPHVALP